MWYVIIILIVGYVIYKFNADRNKLKTKIKQRGGLREIYPVLFGAFLNDERSRIISESTDEVVIVWNTSHTTVQFMFIQLFDRLRITYLVQTPSYPDIQKHFEFANNTDQEFMAIAVMSDIKQNVDSSSRLSDAQAKNMSDIENEKNTRSRNAAALAANRLDF